MSGQVGYGNHPTMYQSLSDSDLYAMYTGSSWSGLGETQRQQLLQETVNRAAAQKGEVGACEVRFADLPSTTLGRQSGNVIEMNRSVFAEDKFSHEYNGTLIEEPVLDSNFRAIETVLHEDLHAWQNQCIDGTITNVNSSLVDEYASNNFSVSMIRDQNGNLQPGSHYLNGENGPLGFYMYYFQSTERDAHYYSQKQAAAIGQYLQGKFGNDPTFAEYMNGINSRGFAAMHQEGAKLFGNVNFDKEINQVLMNQYYGSNKPVDPAIEKAVKQEMIQSYASLVNNNTNTVSPASNVPAAGLPQKAGMGQMMTQAGQNAEISVSAGSQPESSENTGMNSNSIANVASGEIHEGSSAEVIGDGIGGPGDSGGGLGDNEGGLGDNGGGLGDDEGGLGDDEGGIE